MASLSSSKSNGNLNAVPDTELNEKMREAARKLLAVERELAQAKEYQGTLQGVCDGVNE